MEGKPLVLAQIGVAVIAIFIGVNILYGGMAPPAAPPMPQAPPPIEQTTEELKFSQPIYQALVEQDAKRWNVAIPTQEEFSQPIPYFDEVRGGRVLKPGKPVDTRHLKIELLIDKRQATVDGQSFRTDHLVLTITNKTDKFLAYRVATEVPRTVNCTTKGDIPHNAIVISPNRTIERSECLFRKDLVITLAAVEVMELGPLSAVYVSRLPPTLVLYDPRTASSHMPLANPMCRQTVNWQEIRAGVESNQFDWKDLIDFYARHSCDEYTFFKGYRLRETAGDPLPARAPRE
ncbi:MAG: hypothetical protein SGI86_07795 [Deltaproteobacteria bacterium]|nr:hypothetical protein [Deltaproteobacteria bacterium]